MTNLVPRDSLFQDLFDFRKDFDQIFNRFLSWPSTPGERTLVTGFTPAVESYIDKDDKKFHCQVMLPGVDPKEVNIQVQGNVLTISGERREVREEKDADYHHREITYGSFHRSILLPDGVEKDRLSAEYRNGLLEITAPLATAALPKKIEIKSLPLSRHATA